MNDYKTLGNLIRTRRLELGWTQEELAERIGPGVRQSDVSRLERGKTALPRLERLTQIAAVLGLSVGDLLKQAGWFGPDRTPEPDGRLAEPDWSAPDLLIADDEAVLAEAIAALLSDAGYRVELAHDRQSLLLALDRATPAVILADSLLPGLEWNELHSELQRRHLSVHLIVMGVHDTGPALPGVSYLTKPLEATSLLAAIRSILVRDKV